jgi:hypothetical protein
MIAALLALLSTIAASVIHGGDYLRKKIIVMALHALAIAGALWLAGVTGYWLGAALPITAIYWFLFRTGLQAKAEMDVMAGNASVWGAAKAYLIPCATCATLAAALFILAKAWLFIPLAFLPFAFLWVPPLACNLFPYGSHVWPSTPENLKFQRKQRMKVEALVGAFPSGLAIGILIYAVGVYCGN